MKQLGAFLSQPVWGLLALAFAGLVVGAFLYMRKRGRARRDLLVAPALARRLGLPEPGLSRVGLALLLIAVLGVALALARPRWGEIKEKAERRGADVVLLLDTSSSMRAQDGGTPRWTMARQAATSLVNRLGGDRIAIVAFEGEAQTLVPLTLDTAAAGIFLDALEPGFGARPGSSIAAGMKATIELFPAGPQGSRHVVLISDGEDLEGGMEEALEAAKKEGLVLHTVLVGNREGRGVPVPEFDVSGRMTGYKQNEDGTPVLSKPNVDLLKNLAAQTKGTFSVVSPGKTDLSGVQSEIEKSATRPLAETLVTNLEERFQIPLAIGVLATALLLLGGTRFRFPSRKASAAAAMLGFVLLSAVAHGQAPPSTPSTAPPDPGNPATATSAGPGIAGAQPPAADAAPPVPEPPKGLVAKIASKPPFTTARGEAEKGKKALEEKRIEDAVQHFRKESEVAPQDLTGRYNLGSALSKAGKAPEAVAALEAARKSTNASLAADASYNLGTSLYREKDYQNAASAFRDALRKRPGDADAAWNYELSLRKAEEQKKQQEKEQQKKDKQEGKGQNEPKPQPGPSPTPGPNDQKQKQDEEFQSKAKMSRDKAEQLLSAISQSDL
ncbi:MAG: VWA domain-containing protein, partial [Acidobacteria bacterium]|nr:VWA domain-containing protein [Acidobacteriota bacterium]